MQSVASKFDSVQFYGRSTFFFNVPFMHIDIEVVITMLSNIVTGKKAFYNLFL